MSAALSRRGLTLGFLGYLIWGLFPLYWPLLKPAGALEILAHRMVWSLVVMGLIAAVVKQWSLIRAMSARTWLIVVGAASVIALNWGVYIYAVNNGAVVEAALGYFINPLLSVLLGVLIFGERLRRLQIVSVVLGFTAVLVIAIAGGHAPWLSLTLAGSFAVYGLLKKIVPLPAPASLTAEGLVLFLPAAGFLIWLQSDGSGTFTDHGTAHVLLLIGSGLVTVVPLLAFGAAARLLPLSTLGLLQYLTPVVQFILGVWWGGEHMSGPRWIGFVLIWGALVIFSVDSLRTARRRPDPA